MKKHFVSGYEERIMNYFDNSSHHSGFRILENFTQHEGSRGEMSPFPPDCFRTIPVVLTPESNHDKLKPPGKEYKIMNFVKIKEIES